jgi:D-3-phosphoglycerate dehydrogenase
MVANAASALGMEVWGTDPFLSVDAAWSLSRSVKKAPDVDYLLRHCDYLSLHVPLNDSTRNMLDEWAFCAMKPGMRIVNLSRGGLVDNAALLRAIEAGVVASYVTDFPEAELLGVKNVLAIPHLGASTAESEENCAVMAAGQVADYLRDGYIRNSVNLPEFQAPRAGLVRVAIVHRNTPNMLGQITAILAAQGINIEHLFNRSKKDYAYTVVDTDAAPAPGSLAQLRAIAGVARVRVID